MLACWIYCLGLTHRRASEQSKYTNVADGSAPAQMLLDAVFQSGESLTSAESLSAAAVGEDWDQVGRKVSVQQFHSN